MTTLPIPRSTPFSAILSYLLLCAMVLAQFTLLFGNVPTVAHAHLSEAVATALPVASSQVELAFVPNAGQFDARVRFQTSSVGGNVFFTPEEVVLSLPAADESAVLRVQFADANRAPEIEGAQKLPGVVNYLVGSDRSQWRTGLPTYGSIVYQQLYPGVDLRYEGMEGSLKSTFFVAPGADPALLRWRYGGASAVGIDRANGNLHIAMPGAQMSMVEHAPIAWQDIDGQRQPVAVRYDIADDGSVGFTLGSYNPAYLLTIDPVLSYTSYVGGTAYDAVSDVAVDASNNVYLTGRTGSASFPSGGTSNGNADVFIVKLDASGAHVYTTFIGGSNAEQGNSIAVDANGDVYVTGHTYSSNFSGAINALVAGSADVFVAKLDPSGASPASRYLGSDAFDEGHGVVVDTSYVYITGETNIPLSTNFPTTSGADGFSGGGTDAFYSRLDLSLNLDYSTYLGQLSNERGNDIAVHSGNAYIVGVTGPGFPLAGTQADNVFGGGNSDAFIAVFDASNAIVASTYLGGTGDDQGNGIVVDGSGNVYVTGVTKSASAFAASPFQSVYAGQNEAFVARLTSAWTAFDYSTYLGGSGNDVGYGIALAGGDVVVAGYTESSDFPKPAAQAINGQDAFVSRINPATGALVYSTYVGGTGNETAMSVGVQTDGVAVIGGYTDSSSGFSTGGALQTTYGGNTDGFVSKIGLPLVQFSPVTAINQSENNTTAFSINIQLSTASNQAVTVTVGLDSASTATSGTDYTTTPALPAQVTIPAGSTSADLTISMVNDAFPEDTETILLMLTNPINAALGANNTRTVNIIDDDAPPTMSINDVTVVEGSTGTTDAVFTVSLTKAFVYDISVDYATANDAATAGSDYTSTSGTLTFTSGQITRTLTVPVIADTLYEATETFALNLTNARYNDAGTKLVTITKSTGTSTITDDDAAPNITITGPAAAVTEGNSGTTNANFTVALTATAGVTVTVNYATADGTAKAGSDYTATSGTVTFSPGQTSKTVAVPVNGDLIDEDDEAFTLNLSNPVPSAVKLASAQDQATIADDDNPPTVSIDDITVVEGNSGTTNANFTVTLSGASSKPITMTVATANGTATMPTDYTAVNQTLNFAPGQTSETVVVPVVGETLDEDDETFTVDLSAPINATIGDGQGLGTITDDDAQPVVTINDVTVAEGNSGTVDATFTVSLSNPSGRAVTVSYATANGSATAPADYTAIAATPLTFASGEVTRTITAAVQGDTLDETNETFTVDLSAPTNATIGDNQGMGTITDDDGPVLSVSSATVLEGDAGTTTAIFTATLTASSPQDISVSYATQDGSAAAGSDYQAVAPTMLTFASGETSKQIAVTVNGDRLDESDEQFTLALSDVMNATLAATSSTATIVDDDETPMAMADAYTLDEDTTLTVDAAQGVLNNDSDGDGDDALTAALVADVTSGVLTLQPDGTFSYVPAPNFYGTDTFTYRAVDLAGNTSQVATVTLTVRSVNDPATANDDFAYIGKNTPTVINVLANDTPGPDPNDHMQVAAITFSPANGALVITNGGADVTYTPNTGYVGGDSFSYRACDSDTPQYCDTARVDLVVGRFGIYMPMVEKMPQADLVGTLTLSPNSTAPFQPVLMTATVTNQGTAPASNFWVDLYIQPASLPGPNIPWDEACNPDACYGIAWFVTDTIMPGQSITLTSTPDSYVAENTNWPGSFGVGVQRIFLYVDSWNRDAANTSADENGAVLESNETNNIYEYRSPRMTSEMQQELRPLPNAPSITEFAPRSLQPRARP